MSNQIREAEIPIAVVTGAGSGIGRAIAHSLSARPTHVIIAERDPASGRAVVDEIRGQGGRADLVTVDMAAAHAITTIAAVVDEISAELGIVVNNAALALGRPFLETSLTQLDEVMATNLRAYFELGQWAALRMIAQGNGGRIINIGSVNGVRARAGRTAYGLSKAAVIALTRHMALELAGNGITVNCVSPGAIETPMAAAMQTGGLRDTFLAMIPSGRFGTADEVADLVSFLASDAASYVNGQNIIIDGGVVS